MNIRRPFLAYSAVLAVAMCSVVFTMSATATSETCAPTGDETLRSDKDDYQPGHTVHIGGGGFAPGCDVVIRVTRPNGTVLKGDGSLEPGSDTVTTDDDGNLAYDYVLTAAEGESLIGDYLVEALGEDGAVLVSYGFTDGSVADREGTAPWAGTCLNPDLAVSANALNGDNPGNRAECDFGETVVASGFGLESLMPSSATEIGFVVTVEGRVNDANGDDIFDVSISGDQGNNYTAITATELVNANFTSEARHDAPNTAGPCVAGSTFGKTWTYGEISDANFRVKVAAHPKDAANADAPAQDMQIDDIDVSVCWASRTITKARGGAASPLGNVGASLTVDHTGVPDALDPAGTPSEDWQSTSYQIGAGPVVCVDTPNNVDSGADTESFLVPAPATEGSHVLTLIAYSDDGGPGVGCGDRASNPVTTAIVVGIFGESFGTEAVANYELAGDVDNPNWDDGDAGGTNCRTDHLDVGGALAGYTHLRLRGTPTDCAATYTGISTVGRTDIHLRYKWGQSTDNDVTDDGDLIVQWKLNSAADLPANWLPSVSTHDLAPNTTSDPDANSVDVDLGPTAENTSIDLRFIGATEEAADQARVDDVLVTAAPPNTAPTCDDPQSDDVDEDGTLNGSVTCSDADLDPLTYELVDDVTNGTLTFNADGTFTYDPDPDFNGLDSFTFKANDGTDDSNVATFNITVNAVNDPPTCDDPQSDDVDEDGTLLGAVSCADIDSGSLTYELVDDVTNGTLTFNADGTFTYDPDPDFNGLDSFTFKANDGTDDSNVATFNITVNAVNDPPTCDDPQSDDVDEDGTLLGAVSCADIDSGSLTYELVDDVTNGTLTFNADGTFTYDPDPDFNGLDSFTFKANDGTDDSNVATFNITVNAVNDPPTCDDPQSDDVDEDGTLLGAVSCADIDSGSLTYELVDDVTNGTLTFNADGTFTYDPDPDFNGLDSFTFKANDGTDDSNVATFNITVNAVNDPPTCDDDSNSTNQDTPFNDTLACDDIDSGDLDYTVTVPPANGDLTAFDSETGDFTYTPDPGYSGPDSFKFKANDGTADSNEATFNITVIPVDSDGDGLTDNVDCRDNLGDDRAVGLSPVPPGFTGTVHPTLQAAVNAASDDDVITMYVNTTENVSVNGNKDLRIEGCGHKVTAASGASPVIRVLVTAGKNDGNTGQGERDIHIGDLDVRGATSAAGYLIETTKTTTGTSTILKAVRSENNSIGIKITGHGNHLRSTNSTRYNSSDGIQVTGNSNLIESNHVGPNTGDGIEVTGNKNTIKDNDVDSSGGDGIKVASNGNSLSENDSDGNMGDGFDVSGGTAASPNTLFKNAAGVNAYNKGNGFLIAGAGNGTPNPVELAENEAANNRMNGFRVTGTGHELGKNKAWANVLCEYSVVTGNFNSKDNKKNGTNVLPNTDGAAFPTACQE